MSKIIIPKECKFPGVYSLVNIENGKCYVGSSNNIYLRFLQHKSLLTRGKEPVEEMQHDFDNGDNFLFYPVLRFHPIYKEKHLNKIDLVALENQAMNALDSIKNGYNKKQDMSLETSYQRDIRYAKIYTSELIQFYKNPKEDYPYMYLCTDKKIEY